MSSRRAAESPAVRDPRTQRLRRITYARALGLAFVAIGFVLFALGWNGMARVACVDCQLPYLLSAGATGLGFVIFGTALVVVAQMRSDRLRADEQMAELLAAVGRGAAAPAPAASGANGARQVVAGRSAYHRPDCRLVEGKDDLEVTTLEAANERGLSPCRVCNPLDADAAVEPQSRPQAGAGGPEATAPAATVPPTAAESSERGDHPEIGATDRSGGSTAPTPETGPPPRRRAVLRRRGRTASSEDTAVLSAPEDPPAEGTSAG